MPVCRLPSSSPPLAVRPISSPGGYFLWSSPLRRVILARNVRRSLQVQLLFDELLELDTGRRRARLELLSRTDPGQVHELRSLIGAHERAGDFLGLLAAPRLIPRRPPSPPPIEGTYTPLREIGCGGMGRVDLAHDARLNQHVALKLLRGELRTDPERNARFLTEARAAAALDHPNVATIYEIGDARDGGLFIAAMYAVRETLRERVFAARCRWWRR